MPRARLIVHIAEPFDFARLNGGTNDLLGWTAQANPAFSDWVIHLDHPGVIGEEEFDKVRVSSGTRSRIFSTLTSLCSCLVT